MKICVFCAKEFEPTTNKQVCCSKLCNVKKWRKENPKRLLLSLCSSDVITGFSILCGIIDPPGLYTLLILAIILFLCL